MDVFKLSRNWFDWCFENPEKITPSHIAIYFFAIEHCNRLGWKQKFGFPTQMVMDAIGIKKYQTYIKYFNDLIDWGFIDIIQRSKNQYSANIISISSINALPKNGNALTKAIQKHTQKQLESTGQSKDSIDIHINQEPINQLTTQHECDLELQKIIKSVADFFAIDDNPTNHLKNALIRKMIITLSNSNLISIFESKFNGYKTYKHLASEKIHGLATFCGTEDLKFMDGAWNAENWENKIKQYKQQQNGKTTIQQGATPDFSDFKRRLNATK